ncbi:similar to Saccharomyces cerevisiae YNR057C BIO4 Dethiobiotin synthetase, catalyzes the third step in the biotin biosynthesis pathway [Maudiozyma saulgeensis]|uniref:Similar to Saccharomyces cerevisiae YNR057C BIO4 Dethiobiotin synthetase, catalyzes the third step in the biotin biosynthesis pathway n=1 Tax=Maudiozyma saulgeensis TaxID=1789683 RepID=A0A1X7R9Y3_9SACH|nr:similar to Saccharomyces cerevisiae YNR057C BIO4 Dethiobiotin synthetase, catalyzes the third step in the biotin biosynthesis pathway [Kazachstania saulgeensis]
MPSIQPIIFVTGTDTDVGKTFVSGLLVLRWHANYWKPVQTGLESDQGDSLTVSQFCESNKAVKWNPKIFKPLIELDKPLCPLDAVKCDPSNKELSLNDFILPDETVAAVPLIVEGAGGIFVPLNSKLEVTSDLIKKIIDQTERPVYIVVVARSGLGTLNHTLLTYDHLQMRGLKDHILGCVLNGPENQLNKESLELFGVRVIAEIPIFEETSQLKLVLDSIPPFEEVVNEL